MQLSTLGFLSGTTILVASAGADIQFFSDRAAWITAAGSSSFSENFTGHLHQNFYTFLGGPLTIGGGQMHLGADSTSAFTGANYIDSLPYSSTTTSYGAYARPTLVWGDVQHAQTTVFIDFTVPVRAFGFLTWAAANDQGATLDAFSGASLLGSVSLDGGDAAFRGFTADPGTGVTRVRFRSTMNGPGVAQLFALDNLEGSTVPTPPVALPVLALIASPWRRRLRPIA